MGSSGLCMGSQNVLLLFCDCPQLACRWRPETSTGTVGAECLGMDGATSEKTENTSQLRPVVTPPTLFPGPSPLKTDEGTGAKMESFMYYHLFSLFRRYPGAAISALTNSRAARSCCSRITDRVRLAFLRHEVHRGKRRDLQNNSQSSVLKGRAALLTGGLIKAAQSPLAFRPHAADKVRALQESSSKGQAKPPEGRELITHHRLQRNVRAGEISDA